ncbi:hypothetical protein BOTBODRAFT_181699 [Botryobasidium botryosum FD-172 SS1]|uniref:Uncharacterized protein n=1 Tax=Botryobasidium botryosum (strain FD-172 SS1) TaxID=930990 RepID=A0A067M3C7_BOTB1|nr:hypothetical protein BOTBODRAFT_181699 [Botryobasidium botryosum FD-172 SS1]
MSSHKSPRTQSQARAALLPKLARTDTLCDKDIARLADASERDVVMHYQTDSRKAPLHRYMLQLRYAISDIIKDKYEAVAEMDAYLDQATLPAASRTRVTTPPPIRITARRECDNVIERLGLPTSIAEREKIRGLELEVKFTEERLKELGLPFDHPDSSDGERAGDGIDDSETETDVTED